MGYKDKAKQVEFQRRWIARRRQEWVKLHGPCAICGTWDDLMASFRTPRGYRPHAIWSYGPARRSEVLREARVLCGTCDLFEKGLRNHWWWGRLTRDEVLDIASRRMSQRMFAAKYQVSRTVVLHIQQAFDAIYHEPRPEA